MDVAAELKLPPWMEPVSLTGFLDELREYGYNVGTAQYVSAHDLVLALTARGEDLASPARFRSFLGPLVCRSPREQEEFRSVFDRWVSRFEPGTGDEATERRASEEEVYGELRKVVRRSRLWKYWIGLLALLLAGFFWYLRSSGSDRLPSSGFDSVPSSGLGAPQIATALKTPQPPLPAWDAREIGAGLLVVLLLTLVAWRQWWRYRAHLFLVRLATTDHPCIERFPVRGIVDELFETHFLLRTVQGFRQRFEVPSRDLDVEATINAAVRNGGWFIPVFGKRSITPEYLVLIDRASHRDQQARLIEELVERLEKSHVFVSRYYFDGDPRLCFPSSERELPLSLAELYERYPEHRLLLFTDALGLFDFGLCELALWVDQLAQWKQSALLTPRPMEQWRQRELTLRSHLMVLPATVEGLAHLSRIFNSERLHALQTAAAPSLMPEDLHLRPQRWLSRDGPEDRLVEQVLGDLEQFLGGAGFYWLSACAVYPALSWDLILYLGSELRTEEGERLLATDRLAALGQLPWFRSGYMPDWLRLRLVSGMPRECERAVRALLSNLLLTILAGVRHDFYLEIAQRERRTLSRLMRQAFDVLARRSPEDSPLKDHVFRDFMAGRRKRRLTVRLPERIAAHFAGAGVARPLVHAQTRQATKTLLVVEVVLSLLAIVARSKFNSVDVMLISFCFQSAVGFTFLLGCTLRNVHVTSGFSGLLPMTLAIHYGSSNNLSLRSLFLLSSLVLVNVVLATNAWKAAPKENITARSWHRGLIFLTETLAWLGVTTVFLLLFKDKNASLKIVTSLAFIGWPCFGRVLTINGYLKERVGLTELVYLTGIPLAVMVDFSSKIIAQLFSALAIVAILSIILIDLKRWLGQKRSLPGSAKVAPES